MADSDGQAAWDADAAPRSRRRGRLFAAAALALAAVLLLGAFVMARTGPDGDILALGPAEDPAGLPPLDDEGLLTDGAEPSGQSQLTPGDSIPGVPAGGDPAAVASDGATTGGGTPGAAAGAGTPAGGGGPAAGGTPGPGPGQGIPTPTTRPVSTGTPTTGGPGTTPPTNPPPCAITNVSVNPNIVTRQRSNNKLYGDVRVTFRPTNCAPAEYRVGVNGLSLLAVPTIDGFYDAFIRGNAEKWDKGDHTLTVSGGGASAPATLTVT